MSKLSRLAGMGPTFRLQRRAIAISAFSLFLIDATAARAFDTTAGAGTAGGGGTLLAQQLPQAPRVITPTLPSSTILPTDVLPLPQVQNRLTFAENLQLRILQKLPSNFYFSGTCETSFRFETNPFQFPKKRVLLEKLPTPAQMRILPLSQQQQVINTLKLTDSQDNVFRVLPNVTAGWTLTPRTRFFGNYFMIRDSLFKNVRLNTVIHSYSYGVQQDIPLGRRANLQAELQFRELNQMHQHSVFDFLPGATVSFVATPRTVLFANALLQIRGRKYFQAPTRELDPFYTWGALYQRGGWTFSASSTFVQNFREPFKSHATIPVNNYAIISDFEIARRIVRQLPGLQAFVRAEPIWNMHSHNRPGLAGMDFRLFYGLRMSVTKPSLTAGLEQLKQQIEEQELEPPKQAPEQTKPSAYLMPYELAADQVQPIHGMLPETPVMAQKPVEDVPSVASKPAAAEKSSGKIAIAEAEPVRMVIQQSPQPAPAATPVIDESHPTLFVQM